MFPDVSETFWGLTEPVTFQVISRQVVDNEVEEGASAARTIDGAMQPLPAQKLALKPEGMRNWKWWTMWTTAVLTNGDVVTDEDGRKFQVQGQSDWMGGGYVEYELTEKPT